MLRDYPTLTLQEYNEAVRELAREENRKSSIRLFRLSRRAKETPSAQGGIRRKKTR
jgi:hypothetical protein